MIAISFFKMRTICLALLLVSSALSCPTSYTVDPSGDCYKLYGGTALTRFQALRQCQKDGAVLYAPANAIENTRLVGYAAQIGATTWIGVTCVSTDPTSCIDDEGNPNPYSNFAGPVNGNNGGACAAMQTFTGNWYSQDCAAYVAHFVCRYTGHVSIQTCDPGSWLFNNHCYSMRSPNDALISEEGCGNYDGHTSSVHTVGENNFLFSVAYNSFDQSQFSRIGLTSYYGYYSWSDGTTYDYNNWGLPISGKQCVDMSMQGVGTPRTTWISSDCGQPTAPSICKKTATSNGPVVTHVSTLCNTSGGLMQPNGTFWSPNYPLPYADENCNNVIVWQNTFEYYLYLQFPEIYLGETDVINLYDDVISSQPRTTITYSSDPLQIYTFYTGTLKIEFIGNNNRRKNYRWRGLLSLNSIRPYTASPNVMITCNNNNGTYKGYGQFRTNGYGYPATAQGRCQFTLQAKTASNTVAVTFYDFYMGPNDFVTFYDGSTANGNQLISVSGAQPGLAVESTGQYMTIVVSQKSASYRGMWGDFYSN